MPDQETCALDVAERGPHSREEVSVFMGYTKERIRQLECEALEKLRLTWSLIEKHPNDADEMLVKFIKEESLPQKNKIPTNQKGTTTPGNELAACPTEKLNKSKETALERAHTLRLSAANFFKIVENGSEGELLVFCSRAHREFSVPLLLDALEAQLTHDQNQRRYELVARKKMTIYYLRKSNNEAQITEVAE